MDFIDLKTQYQRVRGSMNARIQAVLDHGQFILGAEIAELEKRLADYVRSRHCIACSSGTDTLLIALMAYGVGPGDEVITSPFTFIATGEMIVLAGAKPVFVDIDPRTYNMDPALTERAITPRTKAIMPVALYGQCADMDAFEAIARKHRIPVIEDAAQSFGALYNGRYSCALSAVGSTSFFPSKPLGCYGDGGAVFTEDAELASVIRSIRVHGQGTDKYDNVRIGLNARLDTIQAAVLIEKLKIFADEIEARNRVAARYNAALKDVAVVPCVLDGCVSVWAQYTIRVPAAKRDALAGTLKAQGVPTAIYYPRPLHQQTAYRDYPTAESLPHAEQAAAEVISLPMHPYLAPEVQDRIVEAVRRGL
jgi:UDP-2-acetamido-2-deoxy-ribo-hexuluronate aminotransferase